MYYQGALGGFHPVLDTPNYGLPSPNHQFIPLFGLPIVWRVHPLHALHDPPNERPTRLLQLAQTFGLYIVQWAHPPHTSHNPPHRRPTQLRLHLVVLCTFPLDALCGSPDLSVYSTRLPSPILPIMRAHPHAKPSHFSNYRTPTMICEFVD